MMKIIQSRGTANSWRNYSGVSRVIMVFVYPTRTLTSIAPTDTLYSRLVQIGDPKLSILPILNEWVKEGREIEQEELQKIIKQFRKYKRSKHALEISQWMGDKSYLNLSPSNFAVHLDLTSKVHGLEQAEKYFNNIPNTMRVFQVYGALLNCYANAKSLEKAEAIMQKMRELGYVRTLSYNVMLNLYSDMGKHEKLESLIQEMEEKGITCDNFTFNIRLNAYAASCDIERMELFLVRMEADPLVTMDWNAYAVAANGYLKAGATEKAWVTLKKCEQLIRVNSRRFAYEILMTLYARMGNKDEVYRIWNLHKKIGKFYNMSYLCMISSLTKLDDFEGAEKILGEWEVKKRFSDFRIPNLLISAYCKKGLLGKAESILNRLIESGEEPNASTWDRLALGYHKNNQMPKAVEAMKKAILASHPGWKPQLSTLASCLEYLKGKGDVAVEGEIVRSLEKKGCFSNVYDTLDKHKRNLDSKALRMGEDDRTLKVEMLGGIAE